MNSALLGRRGHARYMVLAEWLAAQIESGAYGLGDYLPAETELCASHGVSRYTVREAIRELKRRGLVTTRHGVGTQVVDQCAASGQFRFTFDSVDEFIGQATQSRLVPLQSEFKRADAAVAPRLQIEEGAEYLCIECHRLARVSEEVVAWTKLLVPAPYAAIETQLGKGDMSVSQMMEQIFKIRTARINQTVEPTLLGAWVAEALGVAPASAGLLVGRTYLDSTQSVFLHSESHHGGPNAVLNMEIRRGAD